MSDPIIQRAYTISEIDRMRRAVQSMLETGHPYDLVVRDRSVEEHLRTYMMAGIGVDDLEREAKQAQDRLHMVRVDARRATVKMPFGAGGTEHKA